MYESNCASAWLIVVVTKLSADSAACFANCKPDSAVRRAVSFADNSASFSVFSKPSSNASTSDLSASTSAFAASSSLYALL